jgi:hypothetical protein
VFELVETPVASLPAEQRRGRSDREAVGRPIVQQDLNDEISGPGCAGRPDPKVLDVGSREVS